MLFYIKVNGEVALTFRLSLHLGCLYDIVILCGLLWEEVHHGGDDVYVSHRVHTLWNHDPGEKFFLMLFK